MGAVRAPGPHGVQRLLNAATWDTEGVQDDLHAYVVEHLGDAASGVLILDGTGCMKKGAKRCGVGTQNAGAALEQATAGVELARRYYNPQPGATGLATADRSGIPPPATTFG